MPASRPESSTISRGPLPPPEGGVPAGAAGVGCVGPDWVGARPAVRRPLSSMKALERSTGNSESWGLPVQGSRTLLAQLALATGSPGPEAVVVRLDLVE